MKRVLIAVLMVLGCASQSWAFGAAIQAVLATGYVASSPALLLTETFDNATDYDSAGWTTSGTIYPNYVTAPSPLVGSESLGIAPAMNAKAYSPTVTKITEAEFIVNIPALGAADLDIFYLLNYSSIATAHVSIRSAGTVRAYHGSTTATSSATVTAGITYHMWVNYTAGTGTNGQLKVYMTAYTGSEVKPGSSILTVTTGTATTDAVSCYLTSGNTVIVGNISFDNLKLYN